MVTFQAQTWTRTSDWLPREQVSEVSVFPAPTWVGCAAKSLSSLLTWEQFHELPMDAHSHVGKAFWVLDHKLPLLHSKHWIICFSSSAFWSMCFEEDGCRKSDTLSISAELWGFCSNGRCHVYTGTQIEELNLCGHSGLSFLLSEPPLTNGEHWKGLRKLSSVPPGKDTWAGRERHKMRWENSLPPREDPAGSQSDGPGLMDGEIPSIGGGWELGGMGVTGVCVSVTTSNRPVQAPALWGDPHVRRPLLRPPLINVAVFIECRVWIQMFWVQALGLPLGTWQPGACDLTSQCLSCPIPVTDSNDTYM